LDPRWGDDAAEIWGRYALLSVGVRCPLDEVVRREQQRRDRTLGQARAHFDVVHAYTRYAIEVDTSTADPTRTPRGSSPPWHATTVEASSRSGKPTRLAR
jgi:chloramphenicol 3-O-phosphotransferase